MQRCDTREIKRKKKRERGERKRIEKKKRREKKRGEKEVGAKGQKSKNNIPLNGDKKIQASITLLLQSFPLLL